MRHYSKVLVEIPDSPHDSPYAIVSIDCDVCGQDEIQIHMSHLGTVLRVLQLTVDDLHEDGASEVMPSSRLFKGTPVDKAQVRAFLDKEFPGWKADRIRRT